MVTIGGGAFDSQAKNVGRIARREAADEISVKRDRLIHIFFASFQVLVVRRRE
jgi:hypothetical protein